MNIHEVGEVYVYDEATEEESIKDLPKPDMELNYAHMGYWAGDENKGGDLYFILRGLRTNGQLPSDTCWLGFNDDSSRIAVWYKDPREAA